MRELPAKEPGTIVRYLVELSDFSDYLRYKISKTAGFYKYCSCCTLFTLLGLILLTSAMTALFVYRCCIGGATSRPVVVGGSGNVDMSFVREFRDEFKAI